MTSTRSIGALLKSVAAAGVLALAVGSTTTPAMAQSSHLEKVSSRVTNPQPWLGDQAKIVGKRHINGNHWVVDVWSPANREIITNNVLLPGGDQPRPSFYLLPGIQGGQEGMNWMTHTDVGPWFADKNVNVVMPLGGPYSLYTDWNQADPILGVNKWNTYMTQELPPLIDAEFHGTGRDAIGGLSSTGAAALDIAAHAPQRFKAAASYSGCPVRSDPTGVLTSTAMMAYGGGSSFNAWGLPGSPQWADHDPNFNPGRLRGVDVFVASASGNPGPIDGNNINPVTNVGPRAVEVIANQCTETFTHNARRAGVNVNRYYSEQGSHSFGLFAHEMKVSWAQTIARAIGA